MTWAGFNKGTFYCHRCRCIVNCTGNHKFPGNKIGMGKPSGELAVGVMTWLCQKVSRSVERLITGNAQKEQLIAVHFHKSQIQK